MAEVVAGSQENFDSLLKRFNRRVQQEGILPELRRREHYEKPSMKRKLKRVAKKRGATKAMKVRTGR